MTYTIFGESHGPAIGVVLEGVPSGVEMDLDFIRAELQRRAPGKSALTTARKEADEPEILSGVFEGKTTGTPLCAVIRNTDTRSGDYAKLKNLPRPSHADYAGAVRYGGFNDYRGGGHFSGRLTAPLVFAGALAKLILREKGVSITSTISILEGTPDPSPEEIEEIILAARKAGDSVGGAISCTVSGIDAGFGAPDFGCNAEGIFAQHLFAVPAVKGIAFGAGFGFSCMRGSEANDPFYMEEGRVRTRTNASGGINGGITNGMPIVFEVAIRPTPSIAMEQDTVDLAEKKNAKLVVEGRHDPCIVQRALPVVEAAAALASCELMRL
ncbi:MAG: chorismate synthase [Clostridiales bacterium]|nr:chorismate synthase [bacterium 210917-SL.2.15]MCI5843478.1 chorismate synthase [Clostridiales bacterium]MDY4037133.1 chorismate synthase [Candidatus Pseudoscilispira sp.]